MTTADLNLTVLAAELDCADLRDVLRLPRHRNLVVEYRGPDSALWEDPCVIGGLTAGYGVTTDGDLHGWFLGDNIVDAARALRTLANDGVRAAPDFLHLHAGNRPAELGSSSPVVDAREGDARTLEVRVDGWGLSAAQVVDLEEALRALEAFAAFAPIAGKRRGRVRRAARLISRQLVAARAA